MEYDKLLGAWATDPQDPDTDPDTNDTTKTGRREEVGKKKDEKK